MEFKQAIQEFLKYLKQTNKSAETIRIYKGYLTSFSNYLAIRYNRAIGVDEVGADDFEKYLFVPPNDKITQVTRQTITIAFKSFYSFAFLKGYCKSNMGKKVAQIKAKPKERTFITEEEMLKIVAKIETPMDKVFIQTLFYAGLRIQEAINLTIDDISLQKGYINISKNKSRYDRKVPISVKLGYILEEHLQNTDSDKVFKFRYSRPNDIKAYVNTILKEATHTAGLNLEITSHICRHSFSSILIQKGVDVVRVQKLLGHQNLRTTSIYLHTNFKALKEAIATL